MVEYRKAPTEAEIVATLRRGDVAFPPFSLALRSEEERNSQSPRLDAVLELAWNGRSRLFAVECKPISTPAMVKSAAEQVRLSSRPPLLWPMVLFPYLPDDRLQELERQGISGIDLCGNGVVTVPGEWLVYRTGRPNLYPQSYPIKNVFRGASSLVARVFLLRPTYKAVGEIRDEIRNRGNTIALSTVSKALARLEEELIVGRQSGEIRLLQPEKLLQRLVENYRPPEITQRLIGKSLIPPEGLLLKQSNWAAENGISLVLTGASSVRFYATMAQEDLLSVYCSDVAGLLKCLGPDFREQDRFANLELLETRDELVYLDRRLCVWASAVQTYLELATSGKRERETAEQVKAVILRELVSAGMDKRL